MQKIFQLHFLSIHTGVYPMNLASNKVDCVVSSHLEAPHWSQLWIVQIFSIVSVG